MTPTELINLLRLGRMSDLNAVLTKFKKKNPAAYEQLSLIIQAQYKPA